MSDLLQLEEKVRKGDEWRGEQEVDYGGETHTILYRHLYEDEFAEAINIIGDENFEEKIKLLQSVVSDVSQEELQEYQDVMEELDDDPDDLSDEQRERLEELQESIEGNGGYECPECGSDGLFDDLDADADESVEYQCPDCGDVNPLRNYSHDGSGAEGNTFALYDRDLVAGAHFAADVGIQPDEEDIQAVLDMTPNEQQERFDRIIPNKDIAEEQIQSTIIDRIISKATGWTAYEVGLSILFESLDAEKN